MNRISTAHHPIEPPQIVVEVRVDSAEQGTRGDRIEDLVEKLPPRAMKRVLRPAAAERQRWLAEPVG